MKCTWKIINEKKGITKQGIEIQAIILDKTLIRNERVMADNNYSYFLSIAEMTRSNNKININPSINNPLTYL
jgi:hypothetical protein